MANSNPPVATVANQAPALATGCQDKTNLGLAAGMVVEFTVALTVALAVFVSPPLYVARQAAASGGSWPVVPQW